MIQAETIREIVLESELFTTIGADCGFDDALNLDSMSLIWLITELERRFAVEIDYRTLDLAHFNSINSIRDFMASQFATGQV